MSERTSERVERTTLLCGAAKVAEVNANRNMEAVWTDIDAATNF